MGFLKKLFGGKEKAAGPYVDKQGVYFYFECAHCGSLVRVRADKQHDLLNEDGGYVWHKTVVDNKCFRRIQTAVWLDGNYQVVQHEISGGRLLSQAEYEGLLQAATAVEPEEAADETEAEAKN